MMLMFTLTNCLTISYLPWFMDLTFQVPMQYCSLQHQILLSSPDSSTTEHHFCFGLAASFFLVLLVVLLHSSPVSYWALSDVGDSSFSVISFCPFIVFLRFSQQGYWGGFQLPPPVIMFSQNSPLWPVHLGWPYTAWYIAPPSYTSPFTMARQWSMKGKIYVIIA